MGKIKNIVYGIGVVVGLTAAAQSCLGMYRFSNAQESIENYETTYAYLELKDLADIDRNGELSDVEKKLMFARLDGHRFGLGGRWRWEDVVERIEERIDKDGRVYWMPEDRGRISYALALYRQEKNLKQ